MPRASVAAVRRMRPMSWADFKHKLHAAGVLSTTAAEVPEVWRAAFVKSFRPGWSSAPGRKP
jgi:hypothetical protein